MARLIDIATQPDAAIEAAVSALAAGLPIGLPTETVYGLAADATNAQAITRIYETKGRPRFNPLICHVPTLAMAEQHGVFDPLSRRLAEAFWPGPLTLVLPRRSDSPIHDLASAGLDTIGLRCPRGFAGDVIAAFGRPLAAPSANTSGKISPTSAAHVMADLGAKIPLVLDGGPAHVGVESTIVKVEGDRLRLLRPGGVSAEEIEAVAGVSLIRPAGASATIEAPGMLASHYAPGAAMRLDATSLEPGEALIRFAGAEVSGEADAVAVFDLSPAGDLREAAANLFDFMKKADATGAIAIAVTPIPQTGLGEAINDRLARAAAPRP